MQGKDEFSLHFLFMKNLSVHLLFLLLTVAGFQACGQHSKPEKIKPGKKVVLDDVRNYTSYNQVKLMTEYLEFLKIPNYALDSPNIRRNAEFIAAMMKSRGIQPRLLDSGSPGTPPAVYGEIAVTGARETVVFYAHYDGQPVNPDRWHPALKPYEPMLLDNTLENNGKPAILPVPGSRIPADWRIYGRSSSDDKAGVMAILNAYQALKDLGIRPAFNIKFLFEGEEEIGSRHLAGILEKHKDLLRADFWIIADGPVHQSGLPKIDFGVRGDLNMHVKVYGPKRPLHSGHYGNWAPNPCLMLSRLLAGMKDDQGMVTIPGFYDDMIPFTASEKAAIATVPAPDAQMKRELGIRTPEGTGYSLLESYQYPSLNINGIRCADAGEKATNIIPTEAVATLDLRQVMGTDHLRQAEKVKAYIAAKGYLVLDRNPTDAERLANDKIARVTLVDGGYNAQRTPLDLPLSRRVVQAVQLTSAEPVVVQPTSGGSLPLFLFEQILKTRVINLGMVNHDNNQHSDNENVRTQVLWDAIVRVASLMIMD